MYSAKVAKKVWWSVNESISMNEFQSGIGI